MQYNIVICDDETTFIQNMENQLSESLQKYTENYVFTEFSSGEQLIQNYQRNEYDLIFLDIEYPGKNGIEIGDYIRNELMDDQVPIVYVSGQRHYMQEAFEVRPIAFLEKPLLKEKVDRVIKMFFTKYKEENYDFCYQIKGRDYTLKCSEILFFSSQARKIIIHARGGEIQFYGVLDHIAEELRDHGFLSVHKSYLVNTRYIKKMEYAQVTLSDDTKISISQSKRREVSREYIRLSRR